MEEHYHQLVSEKLRDKAKSIAGYIGALVISKVLPREAVRHEQLTLPPQPPTLPQTLTQAEAEQLLEDDMEEDGRD